MLSTTDRFQLYGCTHIQSKERERYSMQVEPKGSILTKTAGKHTNMWKITNSRIINGVMKKSKQESKKIAK